MTPHTIIWDFDGTLYPLKPYDSEQILLRLHQMQLKKGPHLFRGILTGGLIYGDMHQWFKSKNSRKLYCLLYGWALRGMPIPLLDRAAEEIASLVSPDDRKVLRALNKNGLRMLVISCGTLDLSEKVLQKAGVRDCFETVEANPLRFKDGNINGVEARLITAEDKLSMAKMLTGGSPQGVMAVGDGYTDIPLLDWVQCPVMVDPELSKQPKYSAKPYYFVRSVDELPQILTLL